MMVSYVQIVKELDDAVFVSGESKGVMRVGRLRGGGDTQDDHGWRDGEIVLSM